MISEASRYLRSNTVTDRNKGKTLLDSICKTSRYQSHGTKDQWSELLIAALEYEKVEIEVAAKKNKPTKFEIPLCMSQVYSCALQTIAITKKNCADIMQHECYILKHSYIDKKYKNEHKRILIDLLENHLIIGCFLSFDTIMDLVLLVKVCYGNSMNAVNTSLGICKGLCHAISFTDYGSSTKCEMFASLVQWFVDITKQSIENISGDATPVSNSVVSALHGVSSSSAANLHYATVSGICDCLRVLLDAQCVEGVTLSDALYNNLMFLFREASAVNHKVEFRNSYKEPLLMYISVFMDIAKDLFDAGNMFVLGMGGRNPDSCVEEGTMCSPSQQNCESVLSLYAPVRNMLNFSLEWEQLKSLFLNMHSAVLGNCTSRLTSATNQKVTKVSAVCAYAVKYGINSPILSVVLDNSGKIGASLHILSLLLIQDHNYQYCLCGGRSNESRCGHFNGTCCSDGVPFASQSQSQSSYVKDSNNPNKNCISGHKRSVLSSVESDSNFFSDVSVGSNAKRVKYPEATATSIDERTSHHVCECNMCALFDSIQEGFFSVKRSFAGSSTNKRTNQKVESLGPSAAPFVRDVSIQTSSGPRSRSSMHLEMLLWVLHASICNDMGTARSCKAFVNWITRPHYPKEDVDGIEENIKIPCDILFSRWCDILIDIFEYCCMSEGAEVQLFYVIAHILFCILDAIKELLLAYSSDATAPKIIGALLRTDECLIAKKISAVIQLLVREDAHGSLKYMCGEGGSLNMSGIRQGGGTSITSLALLQTYQFEMQHLLLRLLEITLFSHFDLFFSSFFNFQSRAMSVYAVKKWDWQKVCVSRLCIFGRNADAYMSHNSMSRLGIEATLGRILVNCEDYLSTVHTPARSSVEVQMGKLFAIQLENEESSCGPQFNKSLLRRTYPLVRIVYNLYTKMDYISGITSSNNKQCFNDLEGFVRLSFDAVTYIFRKQIHVDHTQCNSRDCGKAGFGWVYQNYDIDDYSMLVYRDLPIYPNAMDTEPSLCGDSVRLVCSSIKTIFESTRNVPVGSACDVSIAYSPNPTHQQQRNQVTEPSIELLKDMNCLITSFCVDFNIFSGHSPPETTDLIQTMRVRAPARTFEATQDGISVAELSESDAHKETNGDAQISKTLWRALGCLCLYNALVFNMYELLTITPSSNGNFSKIQEIFIKAVECYLRLVVCILNSIEKDCWFAGFGSVNQLSEVGFFISKLKSIVYSTSGILMFCCGECAVMCRNGLSGLMHALLCNYATHICNWIFLVLAKIRDFCLNSTTCKNASDSLDSSQFFDFSEMDPNTSQASVRRPSSCETVEKGAASGMSYSQGVSSKNKLKRHVSAISFDGDGCDEGDSNGCTVGPRRLLMAPEILHLYSILLSLLVPFYHRDATATTGLQMGLYLITRADYVVSTGACSGNLIAHASIVARSGIAPTECDIVVDARDILLINYIVVNHLTLLSPQIQRHIDALKLQQSSMTEHSEREGVSLFFSSRCTGLNDLSSIVGQVLRANACVVFNSSVLSNNWDSELGSVGYEMVLKIIDLLLNFPFFYVSDPVTDTVSVLLDQISTCESIVFGVGGDGCLQGFCKDMWRCRVLQLVCASSLVKMYSESRIGAGVDKSLADGIKDQFAQIVITGLADSDVRVRLVCACAIPLLLASFSKHLEIYSTVLETQAAAREAIQQSSSKTFVEQTRSEVGLNSFSWLTYTFGVVIGVLAKYADKALVSHRRILADLLAVLARKRSFIGCESKHISNGFTAVYRRLLVNLFPFAVSSVDSCLPSGAFYDHLWDWKLKTASVTQRLGCLYAPFIISLLCQTQCDEFIMASSKQPVAVKGSAVNRMLSNIISAAPGIDVNALKSRALLSNLVWPGADLNVASCLQPLDFPFELFGCSNYSEFCCEFSSILLMSILGVSMSVPEESVVSQTRQSSYLAERRHGGSSIVSLAASMVSVSKTSTNSSDASELCKKWRKKSIISVGVHLKMCSPVTSVAVSCGSIETDRTSARIVNTLSSSVHAHSYLMLHAGLLFGCSAANEGRARSTQFLHLVKTLQKGSPPSSSEVGPLTGAVIAEVFKAVTLEPDVFVDLNSSSVNWIAIEKNLTLLLSDVIAGGNAEVALGRELSLDPINIPVLLSYLVSKFRDSYSSVSASRYAVGIAIQCVKLTANSICKSKPNDSNAIQLRAVVSSVLEMVSILFCNESVIDMELLKHIIAIVPVVSETFLKLLTGRFENKLSGPLLKSLLRFLPEMFSEIQNLYCTLNMLWDTPLALSESSCSGGYGLHLLELYCGRLWDSKSLYELQTRLHVSCSKNQFAQITNPLLLAVGMLVEFEHCGTEDLASKAAGQKSLSKMVDSSLQRMLPISRFSYGQIGLLVNGSHNVRDILEKRCDSLVLPAVDSNPTGISLIQCVQKQRSLLIGNIVEQLMLILEDNQAWLSGRLWNNIFCLHEHLMHGSDISGRTSGGRSIDISWMNEGQNVSLLPRLVSCLMGFSEILDRKVSPSLIKLNSGQNSLLRGLIAEIVGLVGSRNIDTIKHLDMPFNHNNILSTCDGDIENLQTILIKQVYGLLFDARPDVASAAQLSIEILSKFKYVDLIGTTNELANPFVAMLREQCASFSQHWYLSDNPNANSYSSLFEHIRKWYSLFMNRKELNVCERGNGLHNCWAREVWDTENKSFSTWLTWLCTSLIRFYYSSSLFVVEKGESSGHRSIHTLKSLDILIISVMPLCGFCVDVAERVFPLLLFAMVFNNSGSNSSNTLSPPLSPNASSSGALKPPEYLEYNTMIGDMLSERMATHLLSTKCCLPAATRIVCSSIFFFMRVNLRQFTSWSKYKIYADANDIQAFSAPKRKPIAAQKSNFNGIIRGVNTNSNSPVDVCAGEYELGDGSNNWERAFSCYFNIDDEFLVKACLRCNFVLTGLQFLELSSELSRHSAVPTALTSDTIDVCSGTIRKSPVGGRDAEASSGISMNNNHYDVSSVFSRSVAASSMELVDRDTYFYTNGTCLLMNQEQIKDLTAIFDAVHDPDCIHGVSYNATVDLLHEQKLFNRAGMLVESLSTCESILSSNSLTKFEANSTKRDICDTLAALGYSNIVQLLKGQPADDHMFRLGLMEKNGQGSHKKLMQWETNEELDVLLPTYINTLLQSSLTQMPILGAGNETGNEASLMKSRLADCVHSLVYPKIISLFPGESGRNQMVKYLGVLQETIETCSLMKELSAQQCKNRLESTTTNLDCYCADVLDRQWKHRIQYEVQEMTEAAQTTISHRVEVLGSLLASHQVSPWQVVRLGKHLQESIPDVSGFPGATEGFSKAQNTIAHAYSPLFYKLKDVLFGHKRKTLNSEAESRYSDLIVSRDQSEWMLQECKLMFKKGLRTAASNLLDNTIVTVRQLGELGSNDEKSSTNSKIAVETSSKEFVHRELKNILSECFRTAGEWRISTHTATSATITTQFLRPATLYASTPEQKIKVHHTIGLFNAKLYSSMKLKVNSFEWNQSLRVAQDRKNECIQSTKQYELQKKKVLDLKNSTKVNAEHQQLLQDEMQQLRNLSKHMNWLQKECDMDAADKLAVEGSIGKYLLSALSHFGNMLLLSQEMDMDTVFQVVNLWFGCTGSLGDEENTNAIIAKIHVLMNKIIQNAPSFKFIPLAYQIFSRLGQVLNTSNTSGKISQESNDAFMRTLSALAFKLCCDHPYHTLPKLFALIHEEQDLVPGEKSSSRVQCAKHILVMLRCYGSKHDQKEMCNVINSIETMLGFYMRLADTNTDKLHKSGLTSNITFKELQGRGGFQDCLSSVLTCSNNTYPCVLTVAPTLLSYSVPHHQAQQQHSFFNSIDIFSPTATPTSSEASSNEMKAFSYHYNNPLNANNMVRIVKFGDKFSVTETGITRPKIIECMGSDGKTYKQLVKGGDDTRQDAVMQQVFENMNITLLRDVETRKRSLNIRTYRIVPLTPQSGVIEWVENTISLASYLTDKHTSRSRKSNEFETLPPVLGAHSRYYPNDLTHHQIREKLRDFKPGEYQEKERVFRECCARFHPAFRFFFLEKFSNPSHWFSSRQAYTRSVACTSIIGYILGIGDRHSQNILVDERSAEVVHIDFGIVFEQGKVLGIPETVPCRLTRDMIDGMGITGVRGMFMKCSGEVLRVLRAHSLQLLTILEVVIHDPLYKWSLSPNAARAKQNGSDALTSGAASNRKKSAKAQARVEELGAPNTNSFDKDAAERTISRIKNKLHGLEDSASDALSIEGQIEHVVNEAQDVANLSRIFVGWAPWL